ncbi:MAG TPA: hypothetical protein VKW06_22160 [Candidatus Angelobacter sp.]|nr:hypothetical protein [Candidatus Angelobacter sp.]
MTISEAQRDVRATFIGGFAGQLVSSFIWSVSAGLATWYSIRAGIVMLVGGGFFIFLLTQLLLRAMGGPSSLPKGHPMNGLAIQIAFTVPLSLPLIAAATIHQLRWFYPAFMIVVGAHYLPFIFLYGMRQFGVLAGILVSAGLLIGQYVPSSFSLGGWLTAVTLLVFAFLERRTALKERKDLTGGVRVMA